jgi:hypothetical protein
MPFFKPKQQNKKPFPDFNLRYLWLIFWQPKMYYLNDLMILIMITLMFVLVTFNGHSRAKQTIKTQLCKYYILLGMSVSCLVCNVMI